ncbi:MULTISPECIES: 4-(cytidine 5'-diphospho)-2-C-methyl-D-erythritol kinase [Brevibacterium]|uniref:4-diphosphocytidyl-2-C-methyl-D-erythritol kinase n=2 Tax=Brevibacterium casei TaxID=33889 RepID=K9AMU5_9MICO|nr:4-(cytidine 5'-diphospho)-2-C-methyl-D-erythritol kinase [Brevibacterium casei]NJE67146.1 4-(cytidine 5'-diphospho)-2-C-methyl-D-erythritol kinase [Brevibacterium sp. LS14]EKU48654.1 4-diphosphocytidyl-2-C-methyl-D-erythritol kinase [Brevibacterium casei S18]KZE22210.1 4-diphosphocytidyl-2C-methyl-D-erythritol kinase [Brevibacterium casei]MBE4693317.1 4-(cytidine 5'-diphospho)-2-C-methyl-D-erythritol kinase [Brevibacterium casei]MBY3576440.1 4-(cytidine 5'-diphospho)-2-C-methyl-D-erythritol
MSAPTPLRPGTPAPVTVRAPGKINVHLGVGGVDEHGYHTLATVFQALGMVETLTLIPGGTGTILVQGRYADETVPVGESNLARRAITLLITAFEAERDVEVLRDLDIVIDKQVPVAGGMGGGSADAAAALTGAAHLIGGVDAEVLADLALEIGADVPFLLRGGTAIGRGRGEELSPVLTRGQFHWVMATSAGQLSTPEVYGRFDELTPDPAPAEVPAEVLTALAAGDVDTLAAAAGNDLTEAALSLRPELAEVIEAGREAGALLPLLSGSGPTVGFLARDARHALDLAVLLQATRGVKEALRTTGPAPGAHVVTDG